MDNDVYTLVSLLASGAFVKLFFSDRKAQKTHMSKLFFLKLLIFLSIPRYL